MTKTLTKRSCGCSSIGPHNQTCSKRHKTEPCKQCDSRGAHKTHCWLRKGAPLEAPRYEPKRVDYDAFNRRIAKEIRALLVKNKLEKHVVCQQLSISFAKFDFIIKRFRIAL